MHGLLDVDADGFCSVRAETIVQLLNGLHSMYCLHSLLTRVLVAPPAECEELHAHHSEASNETFFTYSMISDCVVGSITQYAHRFTHLFHSVSQVVYYNFPSYNRQTQLQLEELRRADAPAVNVLPFPQSCTRKFLCSSNTRSLAVACSTPSSSARESVLFIGTQFSILYTFVYSPA